MGVTSSKLEKALSEFPGTYDFDSGYERQIRLVHALLMTSVGVGTLTRLAFCRDGALLWAGELWEHLLCQLSAAVPVLLPALQEASPGVCTEQQLQGV